MNFFASLDSLDQLGSTLKKAREVAGLSVETLAEKIGKDPAILERAEKYGYPGLTISVASDIIRACGWSISITVTK